MNNSTLGRLQRVELRTVWSSESGDFTPWLAREENLALLGDTIGLDLDLFRPRNSLVRFGLILSAKIRLPIVGY